MPVKPELPAVKWTSKDGGLWISNDDYRQLERFVIDSGEYEKKLEAIIDIYNKRKDNGNGKDGRTDDPRGTPEYPQGLQTDNRDPDKN